MFIGRQKNEDIPLEMCLYWQMTNRMLSEISSTVSIALGPKLLWRCISIFSCYDFTRCFQFQHSQLAQSKKSSETPKSLSLISSILTTFLTRKVTFLESRLSAFSDQETDSMVLTLIVTVRQSFFCHFHSKWASSCQIFVYQFINIWTSLCSCF